VPLAGGSLPCVVASARAAHSVESQARVPVMAAGPLCERGAFSPTFLTSMVRGSTATKTFSSGSPGPSRVSQRPRETRTGTGATPVHGAIVPQDPPCARQGTPEVLAQVSDELLIRTTLPSWALGDAGHNMRAPKGPSLSCRSGTGPLRCARAYSGSVIPSSCMAVEGGPPSERSVL